MIKFEQLRICLKKNSIFFQVINWIVIGFAGIMVSITSYQLNREKAILDQVKSNPLFIIKRHLFRDNITNFFEEDILNVENLGESALSADVNYITILEASMPGKKRELFIPVEYFFATKSNQTTKGTLFEISGHKNNKIAYDLYTRIRTYNKNNDVKMFIQTKLKTYIRIEYKNILGEKLSACWLSESSLSNYEREPGECNSIFEQVKDQSPKILRTIEPDFLRQEIEKINEKK